MLPFQYFRELRRRGVDVLLITHARVKQEMLAGFPDEHARMVFLEDTWLLKTMYKIGRLFPARVDELLFGAPMILMTQLAGRPVMRDMVRKGLVDVVHQPVPVSPGLPSMLWGLGVPVVIGPMNGKMTFPAAFRKRESAMERLAMLLARRSAALLQRILPGKLRAATLLAANQRTLEALPSAAHVRRALLLENGVDQEVWSAPGEPEHRDRANFLFVGRLVDWKAVDVVLHALTAVPGAQLTIVGDGPMRSAWKNLATKLHLDGRVTFAGWLKQADIAVRLRTSTALVLPSLYECGGAVVLEAMASGAAVIATAWGGPADYLTPECGVLVEPNSMEALIAGFATAMQQFVNDPDLVTRLGATGYARAQEQYRWDRKVENMLGCYAEAIERMPRGA